MDRRTWLDSRYAWVALVYRYPQVEGRAKGYLVSSSIEQIIPCHGEVGQSGLLVHDAVINSLQPLTGRRWV